MRPRLGRLAHACLGDPGQQLGPSLRPVIRGGKVSARHCRRQLLGNSVVLPQRTENFVPPPHCQRRGANHLRHVHSPKLRLQKRPALLQRLLRTREAPHHHLHRPRIVPQVHLPRARPPRHLHPLRIPLRPRLLELHLAHEVGIRKQHQARLIEGRQRLGVPTLVIEHLAEHRVVANRVDPPRLVRLHAGPRHPPKRPLRVPILPGIELVDDRVVRRLRHLIDLSRT